MDKQVDLNCIKLELQTKINSALIDFINLHNLDISFSVKHWLDEDSKEITFAEFNYPYKETNILKLFVEESDFVHYVVSNFKQFLYGQYFVSHPTKNSNSIMKKNIVIRIWPNTKICDGFTSDDEKTIRVRTRLVMV